MSIKQKSNNQGYVLLLVVLIVAGMGVVVPAVLQVGSSERLISVNYRQQIENHYLVTGVANKTELQVNRELQEWLTELATPLQQKTIAGANFSDCQFSFVSILKNKLVATSDIKRVVVEAGKLNLNFATQEELKNLPGIGDKLSNRIIANRKYANLGQLKAVSGIGNKKYNQLKNLVRVVGNRKINLNTAPVEVLTSLSGLGPTLAGRIIAGRPFKQVADLQTVAGIGPATYEELKNKVKVTAECFTVYFQVKIPARNVTVQQQKIIKLD